MATVLRHGRKGGKVSSSPSVVQRALTPAGATFPASLQTPGEGTTIIGDPNAAHPFDPDAITNIAKKVPSGETNVLQFDAEVFQHIGKGKMVGRSKQVRTVTRPPPCSAADVLSKLQGAISKQEDVTKLPQQTTGLQKLNNHSVLVTRKPRESLTLAVAIATTVLESRVLVVVPKYFEVKSVRAYLHALVVDGKWTTVGEMCGQSFEGAESTRLWVTSAEMALLYLTRLNNIVPFTHVVVPGVFHTTQLLSCFVKAFGKWLRNGTVESHSVRLVLTTERADQIELEGMFEDLKITFLETEVNCVTEFSYAEVCALVDKKMIVLEKASSENFSAPTKPLIDHVAQVAAEVVQRIIEQSSLPQYIAIFTAEAREVLTALQEANLQKCAVYSGFKSTEEVSDTKHHVYVMNNARHALDTDNEYTMVLDAGTIRQPTAQHRSESFMAASTTEWESQTERKRRRWILGTKKGCCYFELYSDDVSAMFREDAKLLPDVFGTEDVFVQCARLNLPMSEVTTLLPVVAAETMEQVMHNLSEKCMIPSPESLAITFVGEITARLPVDLDIASFIIGGCNVGLGEAALAVGCVAALPFRPTTPLTYSITRWNEATRQSRERYGKEIARQSDLLADTLVFIEWLKLRARGESTAGFLNEILVQEFRMAKIEGLMNYMRQQLTNYLFLDHFGTLKVLERIASSVRENSTILLLFKSVALARRAAFIRDAGYISEGDRYASMVFVRTSKHLVPHSFIPSSIKWETDKIIVPVILKNNTHIYAGLFSLIHTPFFFASLLLLYPHVEYSQPTTTEKGRFVYFGVSCNCQMKRFVVPINDAVQILDFREKMNLALGCMQVLRSLPHVSSRTKLSLSLKKLDRSLDLERLQKDIRHQLIDLVAELHVVEHQGSFETFATHRTAPRDLLPSSDVPAMDMALLRRFADGTLWERLPTPQSTLTPGGHGLNDSTSAFCGALLSDVDDDDDGDNEVEIIQESYFMRYGPLREED